MGKTADELRTEIAMQREEIGRDVDALGDRVIPARIVERRTEAIKTRVQDARRSVMGDPDDPGSRSIGDRAGDAKERAGALAHDAADEVAAVPDRIRSGAQGNPLAAGLIAFGAGLLAATLLPTSRREEQLAEQLQPQVEKVGAQVGQIGRGVVDDLRPEVQDAVAGLKDEATEAGRRVADDAKYAARETAAAVKP